MRRTSTWRLGGPPLRNPQLAATTKPIQMGRIPAMCCISGGGAGQPMLSKNDFRHCDLFSIFFCRNSPIVDSSARNKRGDQLWERHAGLYSE
jgi:hypothetical protein